MTTELAERSVLWIRGVPELASGTPSSVHWLERAIRGAEMSGGHVELTVGHTLLVSFDGIELEDAVDFARHCLDIARESDPPVIVQVGIALGEVHKQISEQTCALSGAAYDRASALCQYARPFEIVFDEPAEQRGAEQWLFAREVYAERVRGHALEPVHFSKRACRAALARLQPPPLPDSALPAFSELRALITQPGPQCAALRTSSRETAVECVERLLALQPPGLRLTFGGVAGSLRPLGSLALALEQLWPAAHELDFAPLAGPERAAFRSLMAGEGVARSEAVAALTSLLRAHATALARPFIRIEQPAEIDPATLAVLAEVLLADDVDTFVLITLPVDGQLPRQLARLEDIYELVLPDLPLEDRVAVARAVLSLDPEDVELAQRVALLGGESLFGLLEAIRTLVSSGDLVWQAPHFVWRRGPRQAATSVPVEALVTERVAGLAAHAYRVLEVLCSCPRQAPLEFVRRVAARDGLGPEEFRAGLEPLHTEGWVDAKFALGAAEHSVRGALRQLVPPARAAELQSFVAKLLRQDMPRPCFGSGEIAYHLYEAGHTALAADALIEAAQSAMESGFQRMALRLLATAVEWQPSNEIRRAARRIARAVSPASAPETQALHSLRPADDNPHGSHGAQAVPEEPATADVERPESMAKTAMRSALDALAQRDFEAMERWLDAARAAGASRGAAQRVLSLSHVLRGDLESAVCALQRSHDEEPHASVRARDTLCWAIVRLAAGFSAEAVRVAFDALATARRLGDERGEAASLRVLALAYRDLDREADALQLEAAAANRLRDWPLPHPA